MVEYGHEQRDTQRAITSFVLTSGTNFSHFAARPVNPVNCIRARRTTAARIVVAPRCKQARMYWRHHNAACVCAIITRLRSAA